MSIPLKTQSAAGEHNEPGDQTWAGGFTTQSSATWRPPNAAGRPTWAPRPPTARTLPGDFRELREFAATHARVERLTAPLRATAGTHRAACFAPGTRDGGRRRAEVGRAGQRLRPMTTAPEGSIPPGLL